MRGGTLGPLETARLLLRVSQTDDADTFHQLWTERDPRVPIHRRLDPAGRPSEQDIAERIARTDPDAVGPRLLTVTRRADAAVIGYCGLLPGGNGSAEERELAYELLREVHGRGYATEAASAVVAWAVRAGYRRLCAGVWDWNTASRRVLEKLGFRDTDEVGPVSEHGRIVMTVRDLQPSDAHGVASGGTMNLPE